MRNGEPQVQGSMYAITALRETLEKLSLLNHPFPFPCIIITLTGMWCCLFWRQELTNAPSQETMWDFVAQSSHRALNLKYLPPAILSTPIFTMMSCLLCGSLKPFSKLHKEYQDLFTVQSKNLLPANSVDFPYPCHYDDNKTGEQVSFIYNKCLNNSRLLFLATAPAKELCLFIKFTWQYGGDAHHA